MIMPFSWFFSLCIKINLRTYFNRDCNVRKSETNKGSLRWSFPVISLSYSFILRDLWQKAYRNYRHKRTRTYWTYTFLSHSSMSASSCCFLPSPKLLLRTDASPFADIISRQSLYVNSWKEIYSTSSSGITEELLFTDLSTKCVLVDCTPDTLFILRWSFSRLSEESVNILSMKSYSPVR